MHSVNMISDAWYLKATFIADNYSKEYKQYKPFSNVGLYDKKAMCKKAMLEIICKLCQH